MKRFPIQTTAIGFCVSTKKGASMTAAPLSLGEAPSTDETHFDELGDRDQPIFEKSENIGRYIAITIVPMTTPKNTIMMGSINFIKPLTAVSTSSS